ncbi:MAG: hypothetical protein JSS49_20500 [Planctomycetes bacterium]|nr:hypothetical protein [Planctomycetota bacterium]
MDGRFTALLILAGLLCADGSVYAAAPQPIATNKTRFRIPFKIEQAALLRLNARELQLHVSKDGGVSWELAQALPPDGAKFEYQAAGDGEYRFAVKTLDGRNQIHPPPGQYETGLIVVVDTLPPLLDLSLQQLSPGRVQLSWNAADAHLDVSTLRIEYQQPGSSDWETVEVTPKPTGQIAWNVHQAGQVKVRGTISDTATNIGRGQSQAQIIPVADPVPKPKPRRQPIAEVDDGREQASADPVPEEPRAVTSMPGAQLPATRNQPAEDTGHYRGPVITPFGSDLAATPPATTPPAVPPAVAPTERFVAGNPFKQPEITKDRWGDYPEAPPMQPQTAPPNHLRPAAPLSPAPRNLAQVRVVNSRRFQVGYTVDDVGPSGIGAVELFITQDQGRKWWKYGDDPDRRSPFDVEVPQDGEYGFSIRVRSGVGLTNDPPLPGEPPSIVVAVDQTPPTVELLSAQQGQGSSSNRVQVRWRISDEHLASKPVSVYYSMARNGPWEPVSGWTDDQGGLEWTVVAGMPPQFYVRVVARDIAGNTAKAESTQPILVDMSRPTARIVDVEAPLGVGPK